MRTQIPGGSSVVGVVCISLLVVVLGGCRSSCPETFLVADGSEGELIGSGAPRLPGLDIPEAWENVALALPSPRLPRYPTALYEGNNAALRFPTVSGVAPSGAEVARRWRDSASSVARVFVLRDSLYSQQDHPFRYSQWSMMLPPSWVSVAVEQALVGGALARPQAPAPGADGEWRRLRLEDAFGGFPPSPSLVGHATTSLCGADEALTSWIVNARRALGVLAQHADAMLAKVSQGPEAVAREGAELVAASDRRYFGSQLRRETVVPILVESPTPEEVREGKGLRPRSRPDLSEKAVDLARGAILRRRLRDGDTAVERYDLADPKQLEHAVRIARDALTSTAQAGVGRLWIWVLGGGDAAGDGAAPAVAAFRRSLEVGGVPLSRLGLFLIPTDAERDRILGEGLRSLERAAAPIPIVVRLGVGEGSVESAQVREPGR